MAIDDEKKRRAAKDVPLGGASLKPDGTIDADDRRALAGDYSTFTVSGPTVPPPDTTSIPPEISPTPTEPLPTTSTADLATMPDLVAPIHAAIPVDKQTTPIGNIARLNDAQGYAFSVRTSKEWTNFYGRLTAQVNTLKTTMADIDLNPHIQSYAPGGFTIPTGHFAIMARHLILQSDQRATLEGNARLVIT